MIMKRILSFLLRVVFIVIVCLAVNNFSGIIDSFKWKNLIKEDQPSQVQIENFEAITKEKCFYYYDNLPDSDKDDYVSLYYGFMDYDDSIYIGKTESDIENLMVAVLYDNPDIFWVDYNYEFTSNETATMIAPEYRFTAEESQKMQSEIDEIIGEVISQVSKYNSDYEKELYIHDYVIDKTEYDISTLGDMGNTVYNTLIVGKAICEGYAKTMQILLDEAGIDNYLVTGEAENDKGELEQHMWNIVTIGEENYHLDATWDDLNDVMEIGYFYFNVTDEYISRDHKNLSPSNNNCVSKNANYFVKNNFVVSDYNGFSSHINRSVKALSNGSNEVVFYFTDHNDYEKALKDLENDNGFFKYVFSVVDKSKKRYRKDNVDYVTIDAHNYLSIVFKEG